MAEVTPPVQCWSQIEARLDKEFNLSEIHLSSRLTDTEVTPPVLAWQNIQPYLADIGRQPAKVIPITFSRIAVAASILVVLGLAGWYVFVNNNFDGPNKIVATNAVGAVVAPKKSEGPVTYPKKINQRVTDNITPESAENTSEQKQPATVPVKQKVPSYRRTGPAKVGTISPVEEISIQAPPITDADGNLIMDINLLRSSGDDHYITVTGPNGQQTRISDKFLNMIHYLNAPDHESHLPESAERRKWKARIKEWKNKLLEQAGYFPANNYMGIMDLKEMIQDK